MQLVGTHAEPRLAAGSAACTAGPLIGSRRQMLLAIKHCRCCHAAQRLQPMRPLRVDAVLPPAAQGVPCSSAALLTNDLNSLLHRSWLVRQRYQPRAALASHLVVIHHSLAARSPQWVAGTSWVAHHAARSTPHLNGWHIMLRDCEISSIIHSTCTHAARHSRCGEGKSRHRQERGQKKASRQRNGATKGGIHSP